MLKSTLLILGQFHHEHFVLRAELSANDPADTHGRVVTLGRHQNTVPCLEQVRREEFCARLAIAPGDTDDNRSIPGKCSAGVSDVPVPYRRLNRLHDRAADNQNDRSQQWKKPGYRKSQPCLSNKQCQTSPHAEDRGTAQQASRSRSHHQGLLYWTPCPETALPQQPRQTDDDRKAAGDDALRRYQLKWQEQHDDPKEAKEIKYGIGGQLATMQDYPMHEPPSIVFLELQHVKEVDDPYQGKSKGGTGGQ